MNTYSVIAICLFVVSTVPQIRRLLVRKEARDISLGMSFLISTGNLLMLFRAIGIQDTFFAANYALQLLLWLVITALIVVYRR
jgi:uncharacterized protein with PQ loop repeat